MERDLHVEIAHTAEHGMELEFWGLFGLKEENFTCGFGMKLEFVCVKREELSVCLSYGFI